MPKATLGAGGYRTWAGTSRNDLIAFAGGRRAESRLRAEYPDGSPERSVEKAWLAFNVASLELVSTSADLKRALLRVQLLRQLCRGNPIGIVLCVRSLIENHAVSQWLPEILAQALDQLGSSDDERLSGEADRISNAIAQVLTTHAADDSVGHTWAIGSQTRKPRASIDLPAVVRLAFPEGEFWSKQYDFGSAVMHGRIFRSVQLSNNLVDAERSAKGLGLLALAKLSQDDIDPAGATLIQGERMRHAAQVAPSGRDGSSRWTWGFGETLEGGARLSRLGNGG